MVGNCALDSQIAGGMLLGHCDGYRALLGWLNEGIRREIMRVGENGGLGVVCQLGFDVQFPFKC